MDFIKKITSLKKINILPPKKNKILFIGSHNVDLFKKHILNNNHSICELNSLNLLIFIISLFRKYTDKFIINYYINFIKFSKPTIVATFVDNHHYFYLLKNFFNKKIFISIQNGWRGKTGDFFEKKIIEKFTNLKSDYILTFNDALGEKFKENIKCESIKIGSFRNNIFKINKFTKKNSLAFISSYKNRENEYFHNTENSKISFKDYFLSDKFIVNFLSKYCLENNLEFFIIPCKDNEDEYNYYKLDEENHFKMLLKKDRYCSYEYVDDFKQQIGTDTSLGYESLFRGNKVGFFNIRKNFISKFTNEELDCHNFLWPSKLDKEGPFWTHKADVNSMKRVLEFIINSSDIEWNEALNNINKKNYILHDYENTILKGLIKKILKKNAE